MAQEAGQRRSLRGVFLLCALGIGILVLPAPTWLAARHHHVEMALHAFQLNPSQAGADKLIALLEKRSPTRGQAARILQLLLRPNVVTRSAYPVGRKPTISTLLPFHLRFQTAMTCRVEVLAGGQGSATHSSFTYLGVGPHVLASPAAPSDYGKFSMELKFYYFLTPPPESRQPYPTNPATRLLYDLRRRIKGQGRSTIPMEKWYQAGFSVPVDINAVAEGKAEHVRLLSNPELDRHMREALRPDDSFRPFHMLARRLPANVVFACFLELPDGTRTRSSQDENQHMTGYANRDFEVGLWLDEFRVDPSRVRNAKLVFEPDPNYAFEEPTIKSIWNGRLEFPIHVTVAPEPDLSEKR